MNKLRLIIYKVKSHSKATQVIFVGLLVVLLAALIMGIFLIINSNMRVNGFIIEGECSYTAEQLAEYAGIKISNKFGKIDYKESEEKILGSAFYIKDVKISRNNLTKIKFVITMDKPTYYSKISNEYYVLASDFRILERVSGKLEIEGKNLIGIKFPTLRSAIVGQYPDFSEQYNTYDYIQITIKAIEDFQLSDRINAYDFSDKFSIKFIIDELFLIKLGNCDNLEKKLDTIKMELTPQKVLEGRAGQLNFLDPNKSIYIEDTNGTLVLGFD
jgi:hypothetical protein